MGIGSALLYDAEASAIYASAGDSVGSDMADLSGFIIVPCMHTCHSWQGAGWIDLGTEGDLHKRLMMLWDTCVS